MDWFYLVLIYLLGLALAFLEIFIPSGGLIGIASALCLTFSLWKLFGESVLLGSICVVLTVLYVFFLVKWGFARLKMVTSLSDAHATGQDVQEAESLIGEMGEALTALRPAGVARISGRRFDVVTQGAFVERGQAVKVVEASGNRIQVRGC